MSHTTVLFLGTKGSLHKRPHRYKMSPKITDYKLVLNIYFLKKAQK